ncbi:diguanylate cyclase [Rubrivivax gelatinosus]|uniref:Diguanylate cyclase n=1 Tax=Rubrivivax gelatinosus TaxID=28068 RepID=A0ABS1DS11_RUBGE|nr:diguanylate cyclase [Rubrivivax gelatinosus]MBK1614196.1 diguanylate cyclase [Rubrivivax gelatinosus]MBK1712792.1 diguanylate cyclase [Rubrivivax gelatinosus]
MTDVIEAGLTGARVPAALASLLSAWLERDGALAGIKDAASGRYEYANAALLGFLGREADAVIGHTDAELFDAPIVGALRAADQSALLHGAPFSSEHRIERGGQRHDFSVLRVVDEQDGRRLIASLWIDLAPERHQQAQLATALAQIEQLQKAAESLRRELADQALRDPASGLYTRAHFEDQLRREVDLSTREHREFSIVFIELDPLSEQVRALGEDARKRILEALGRLLRSGTRAMDASCRLDDRRFAVLLSGVGLATAHSRIESIRRQCAAQVVVLDGQEMSFTVAMGIASFPHTAHTRDELLTACETALIEARRRGGNHVTLAAIPFEPR